MISSAHSYKTFGVIFSHFAKQFFQWIGSTKIWITFTITPTPNTLTRWARLGSSATSAPSSIRTGESSISISRFTATRTSSPTAGRGKLKNFQFCLFALVLVSLLVSFYSLSFVHSFIFSLIHFCFPRCFLSLFGSLSFFLSSSLSYGYPLLLTPWIGVLLWWGPLPLTPMRGL